jgi:hypothetical protein
MRAWKGWRQRLSYLLRREAFDADLDEEIGFHLDSRVEELIQSGLSERDARTLARREFGAPTRVREESRSPWQFQLFEDLVVDLVYAARALRRNPGFAAAAVLSLALGIGANLAIFSLTMEFLFSRPSVHDASSLAYIVLGGNSNAEREQYRFLKDAHIFENLGGMNPETEANWRYGENTHRVWGTRVTDNFFDVAGVPVALGRPIRTGGQREAVLSYGFWKARLASDPNVLGRGLVFDGSLYTVVGIPPPDHRTLLGFGFAPDLYLTIDPTLQAVKRP